MFEINFEGQVPTDLENLNYLKEMNISYNKFSGLVTKKLAQLDTLNMTMLNENGEEIVMSVTKEMNGAVASEE